MSPTVGNDIVKMWIAGSNLVLKDAGVDRLG